MQEAFERLERVLSAGEEEVRRIGCARVLEEVLPVSSDTPAGIAAQLLFVRAGGGA